MDAVFRAVAIYLFLMIVFRITGRRVLSEVTTFDFVLLLVIGEATQQALLGDDFSVMNAFIVIVTLLATDITLSLFKERSERLGHFLDGLPMVIVEHGTLLEERIRKARIDYEDIMKEARLSNGIERLDQIKYAVLENNGKISFITYE